MVIIYVELTYHGSGYFMVCYIVSYNCYIIYTPFAEKSVSLHSKTNY